MTKIAHRVTQVMFYSIGLFYCAARLLEVLHFAYKRIFCKPLDLKKLYGEDGQS